jgi:SAM-dependent methyltransferase
LMFGQTYEDPEIELTAIPPGSRVFCIAGAGTTAQALAAAGHRVTAVDISPAQVEYAQERNAGGRPRDGMAERLLDMGRGLAALCGWTRHKLDDFLNLTCCSQQLEYWDRELNTPAWRATIDTLLAPRLLRLGYRGPFVAALPSDFGPKVRERLRRGWATHGNRSNPFAALLLAGHPFTNEYSPGLPIRFVCADAADFLERCAPDSFDAFALSNIGDGASTAYRSRLVAALERAGARQAVVISRSFSEPCAGIAANLAAMDRSLLWGVVSVCRLAEIGKGGESCCIC